MRVKFSGVPRTRVAFPSGNMPLFGLDQLTLAKSGFTRIPPPFNASGIVPPEGLYEPCIQPGSFAQGFCPIPPTVRTGIIEVENPKYFPPGWIEIGAARKQIRDLKMVPLWQPPIPLTRESFYASKLPGYARKTYIRGSLLGQDTYVTSAQAMLNEGAWYQFGVANGYITVRDSFMDKISDAIGTAVTVAVAAGIGYGLVSVAGAASAGAGGSGGSVAYGGASGIAPSAAAAPTVSLAPSAAIVTTPGIVATAPAGGILSTAGKALATTALTSAKTAATGIIGQKATDSILVALGLAPKSVPVDESQFSNQTFGAPAKPDFLKTAFPWIVALGIIAVGYAATKRK